MCLSYVNLSVSSARAPWPEVKKKCSGNFFRENEGKNNIRYHQRKYLIISSLLSSPKELLYLNLVQVLKTYDVEIQLVMYSGSKSRVRVRFGSGSGIKKVG